MKWLYKSSTQKSEVDFLLSLSHKKKIIRMSFASPLRHRKSVDLPPDRAGGGGGEDKMGWEEGGGGGGVLRGIHSHSNSS